MINLTSSSSPSRTTIWNLCQKGIDKFNQHIFRIPRIGKKISMWEDKILGNTPLSFVIMLEKIKASLTNKGLL